MANKKELLEEFNGLQETRSLIVTYQEIAAMRMKRVKALVLRNREFLTDLNEIYQQVRYSYKKQYEMLKGKKGRSALPAGRQALGGAHLSAINDRVVSIFLSSNTMLYGDIVKKTFDLFMTSISKIETDVVIVGRIGLSLYLNKVSGSPPYKYFDLSDGAFSPSSLREIIDHSLQYGKIYIFHGRFMTMLEQVPEKAVISGDLLEAGKKVYQDKRYIFEPSLEKIVEYFESEILTSFFDHSVHESYLSKYTARMINLEGAVGNINGSLKKTAAKVAKLKHRVFSSKQHETIAGISLWG